MGNAFHLGGWGMYPTTLIGVLLIVTAIRFAMAPDARRMTVVRCLSFLTFLSGCLGFVAGAIKTLTSLGDLAAQDGPVTALIGLGESLNNIGLGVCLLVVAWIAVTLGVSRAKPTGAELIDSLT